MKARTSVTTPTRPARLQETPVPPIPDVSKLEGDIASTEYSRYRTGLSNHRTSLSEHRTSLSEYRTDLSSDRTEMSTQRTDMSFQRTHLSIERTTMSVIRTALSLIGFGFTIFQFFNHLKESQLMIVSSHAPRNFGLALVATGLVLLTMGIVYHARAMLELRRKRSDMGEPALIHDQSVFPVSMALVAALLLWALGVLAIAHMAFGLGPLG
jgi:uncharacterized membrane protein YidH (DUF202 family)